MRKGPNPRSIIQFTERLSG